MSENLGRFHRHLRATLTIVCGAAAISLIPGCRKPAPENPRATPVPVAPTPPTTPAPTTPAPTPAPATPPPAPTPTPPPYVPAKRLEVGKIFNGMEYRLRFETSPGTTAATEREDPESYTAELTVKVRVPKPHRSLPDLSKLNAHLPELLPALGSMVESARVSTVFDDLYRRKCESLNANLRRLDVVLTRHNFYDCETVLELQHPQSKRRAILIQADMDTDTDGSDGDRMPETDGGSLTFQPMTSYRWEKKTATVNPFLPGREAKLKLYEAEAALPATTAARKAELKELRDQLRLEIADLKRFSFLVGAADPFIVLPTFMFRKSGGHSPSIGDYCVVIYGDTLYPGIVGDAGPMAKMGEGSLRLAKQIQPKASGIQRAENDLKVTYLVFPGTVDKPWTVPDLARWREKCERLLQEMGGYTGTLFTWEDITKPKLPPATPPPTTPPPGATPAPATPPAPAKP